MDENDLSGLRLTPAMHGVEVLEFYLPLDASPSHKRLMRQNAGKMIADKIAELNAYEMVPGPEGVYVLRCRLVIHFSGVAAKPQPAKET